MTCWTQKFELTISINQATLTIGKVVVVVVIVVIVIVAVVVVAQAVPWLRAGFFVERYSAL